MKIGVFWKHLQIFSSQPGGFTCFSVDQHKILDKHLEVRIINYMMHRWETLNHEITNKHRTAAFFWHYTWQYSVFACRTVNSFVPHNSENSLPQTFWALRYSLPKWIDRWDRLNGSAAFLKSKKSDRRNNFERNPYRSIGLLDCIIETGNFIHLDQSRSDHKYFKVKKSDLL